MKNEKPAGSHARFASTGQRMLVILMLAVFAGLIWLAWTGRFDREMQQMGAWLHAHYESLAAWMRANL